MSGRQSCYGRAARRSTRSSVCCSSGRRSTARTSWPSSGAPRRAPRPSSFRRRHPAEPDGIPPPAGRFSCFVERGVSSATPDVRPSVTPTRDDAGVTTSAAPPMCAVCGEPLSERARFCANCGAPVETSLGTDERKMVTVVFADLVDSTGLAQRLDPERAREVLGRFFDVASEELLALRGRPEKFIGDAVMAVFGLPTVHEDDALRAVRAGLAIRARIRRLSGALGLAEPLQLRIGVAPGEAATGIG